MPPEPSPPPAPPAATAPAYAPSDEQRRHPYRRPSRRPLRIFALDPMRIRQGGGRMVTPRATVYIPFEDDLQPGPRGRRLHVIDYDGVHKRLYEPIDLNHPDVLIRDGLAPTEGDPRFHQQMVYAVISNLWADFETALGRRIMLGRKKVLTVIPHAMYQRNAFYDPEHGALLFGYFQAGGGDVGTNMPGQMIYTCLSHDIICHETTHALIDRLRPEFMIDSNPDVVAFHEGFSDLIAIFQHFKLREVLEPFLAEARGTLRGNVLLGLARQFGYATGSGAALRSAEHVGLEEPDPSRYRDSDEPHERGAVLVRAVFDAFLSLYEQRTADLVRLASEGTGILREGAIPPDLVGRLAEEASTLASEMFTILLRSFDYLPPTDVTFEDLLRALVTLDLILSPSDESMRVALIEGFRRHGIYPTRAGSLSDDAVAWGPPACPLRLPQRDELLVDVIRELDDADPEGYEAVESYRVDDQESPGAGAYSARAHDGGADRRGDDRERIRAAWTEWAKDLVAYASEYAAELSLDPTLKIELAGMHQTIRDRANGRPTIDVVVRFVQRRPEPEGSVFQGFAPRGGTTVVADSSGRVRFVVPKPLPIADGAGTDPRPAAVQRDGAFRLAAQRRRIEELRGADPGLAYRTPDPDNQMRVRFNLVHATHGDTDRRSNEQGGDRR